jgi:hypothetical protein
LNLSGIAFFVFFVGLTVLKPPLSRVPRVTHLQRSLIF